MRLNRFEWAMALAALLAAAPAAALAQTGAPADTAGTPPAEAPVIQPPPAPPTPPDFPRGRISGLMFGDAYYNVVGDPNPDPGILPRRPCLSRGNLATSVVGGRCG